MQSLPPLKELFQRFLDNKCSPEEFDRLIQILTNKSKQEIQTLLVSPELTRESEFASEKRLELEAALNQAWEKVLQRTEAADISRKGRVRRIRLLRFAAAAAILVVTGTLGFYYFRSAAPARNTVATVHPNLNSGSITGVMITLGDGSVVAIDSLQNGHKIAQGKAALTKYDDGHLVYTGSGTPDKLVYNTISTGRGRQFQLTLQDGTKVWLNAGSSISYPTVFAGNERSVSIVGEVYLEVSKNKARPFHVNVKGMSIEVLGTHFNVRAHEEEKEIKTTLLEGSVKIHNGNSTAMLRPGQEAKVNLRASQEIRVQPADVESVTAWINGYFRFDNADIYQLMGEISRWYDVEVTFEGEIQNHEFVGQIARSSTLPEVLDILEMENVRITQEGNTLIVHP